MFTILGMHEAVNIQTKTDKRSLDVHKPLLDIVARTPLHFLQMYVDSPHCQLGRGFCHPISGCVAMCDLQHLQSKLALRNAAGKYLQSLQDCLLKMRGQTRLRLEYVTYIDRSWGIPHFLRPEDGINLPALEKLFETCPVVLPFVDTESCKIVSVIHDSLDFMVSGLTGLYLTHRGKGGFDAAWQAFQFELACEEVLYGRPLSNFDTHYSASLGTCSVSNRSLTHCRGFIGLAPFNSASIGEDPPPIHLWSGNRQLVSRVERLFPLTNCLQAGPAMIGAAMLRVALADLYEGTVRDVPWGALQGSTLPDGYSLQGSLTIESLASDMVKTYHFSFPHTFNRGKEIVREAGHDVVSCLLLGFQELGLTFFPRVRLTSQHKNYCVRRLPNLYVAVHPGKDDAPMEAQIATLSGDICTEMERRKLSYARNLERYRFCGMPWLQAIMRRLPPLSKDQRLAQLTFLSCVGLRMNGDFIDYGQLKELARDMPLAQAVMQKRLIQSQELMEKLTVMKVWKLHRSIPYRMTKLPPPAFNKAAKREDVPDKERQPEEIREVDPAETTSSRYSLSLVVPNTTIYMRWDSAELALIPLGKGLSHRAAYNAYVNNCQAVQMRVRTFSAFLHRRRSMLKSV